MEKDFWSYFNFVTADLPTVKQYDPDEMFYLMDEKINNIKQVIFSKDETGISYLMENLETVKHCSDHINYLRKEKPGAKELAGIEGLLQSLCDGLFEIMDNYKPKLLSEDGCKSFAEKYCSVQVYEMIFDNQIQPSKEIESKLTLEDLFEKTSQYAIITGILSEKEYIDPITMVWKDNGKGNKGYLSAMIKNLHEKGYLTRKPTAKDIKAICSNTFKLPGGIDNIYKVNSDSFNFDFIPYSQTLP